ncbi:murein hydrolase activator EnvC family protein [Gluconacetobacter dulcium]|uniref:murein hydrolase activator EnvC family protein n=1 Tax=Gluconacetobacter dulcium TaxID=2729096 RepID=UPI002180C8D5|nr:peptidoglycan DD-metalloendopeptidase family protein [Gluconacetobacter dulcium]
MSVCKRAPATIMRAFTPRRRLRPTRPLHLSLPTIGLATGLLAGLTVPDPSDAAPPHTSHPGPHHHAAPHASQSAAADHAAAAARRAVAQAHAAQQALIARQQLQARDLAARTAARDAARAQARQDAARAAALSEATVDATTQLQQTEQQTADLGDRVATLRAEQTRLRAELSRDSAAVTPMLPLAARLARYPADTLLAAPVPPDRAIAGLLVIQGLSAQLEQRANAIRTRRAILAKLDSDLAAKGTQLAALQQKQAAQRDSVARAAEAARQAQQRSNSAATQAARRVEDATRRASSLQDAVNRIEALEKAAEDQLEQAAQAAIRAHRADEAAAARARAAAIAQGPGPGLTTPPPGTPAGRGAPVPGTIVTAWGATTEAGPASGITYAPPSAATVRAPCAGQIDFAGAFRSYGQMVILNCGRHYRFVLAGLGALAVSTGQALAHGAPLGRMPDWSGQGARPTLFVQLRHGGGAVDPAPFL